MGRNSENKTYGLIVLSFDSDSNPQMLVLEKIVMVFKNDLVLCGPTNKPCSHWYPMNYEV